MAFSCFGTVTEAAKAAAAAGEIAGETEAEVTRFCSCSRISDVTCGPFPVSVDKVRIKLGKCYF